MTGEDSCTELVAEPHRDADIAACLPDGSRVMLAVRPPTTHAAENGSAGLRDCHAAAREQATPPMGCRSTGSACKRETASKAGSRKSPSTTTSDATREASVASMTSANPGRVAAKPNVALREGFESPTPSCPNWRSGTTARGIGEALWATQQLPTRPDRRARMAGYAVPCRTRARFLRPPRPRDAAGPGLESEVGSFCSSTRLKRQDQSLGGGANSECWLYYALAKDDGRAA